MAQHDHKRYIKVFPGLVTYVGHTHEEALKKKAELDQRLPIKAALKQLSFSFNKTVVSGN